MSLLQALREHRVLLNGCTAQVVWLKHDKRYKESPRVRIETTLAGVRNAVELSQSDMDAAEFRLGFIKVKGVSLQFYQPQWVEGEAA